MKNDDGALSFGTSVDLRGLETGISQIEAKIATMEGKLGAKIDGIGKAVTVVKSSDTTNLAKVNGLLAERVRIPLDKTVIDVTCAVTREGKIYADRADIPASVDALLPKIEFVREA